MYHIDVQISLAIFAGSVCLLYILWCAVKVLNVAVNSELSRIPGPFLSAFTNLPLKFAILSGKRTVYIHALHEKYGPYVRIAPQEIAIADIDAAKIIHRTGLGFDKGPWYQGQTPTQYNDETCGVFGIRNMKAASQRRRLFQTAGTKKVVMEWEPEIVKLANRTVEKVRHDLEVDGRSDVMKWWTFMTSDVLGYLAFGEPFDNVEKGERNQLVKDVERAMMFVGLRLELPWIAALLETLPSAILGPLSPPWNRLITYGTRAVENTRLAVKGGSKTLFSKIIPDNESQTIVPDSVIRQEALNVIIAGTDTTAMSLTYLIYYVLSNNEVKRKLIKEVQTCSAYPDWAELERMPYLNNVIQETLRLHPALPGSLTRSVPKGGEHLGGYFIPGEIVVGTQAWTFHRDPHVFKNPTRFDPDRWISPTPAMKQHFMAFGGAARYCLGENVARMEMLHAVSKLFRECPNIELAHSTTDESMEMVDFFSIKPKAGMCEIISA